MHVFICCERKRCQRRLGYTHSRTPNLGIVARSENSYSMVEVLEVGLKLVAENMVAGNSLLQAWNQITGVQREELVKILPHVNGSLVVSRMKYSKH